MSKVVKTIISTSKTYKPVGPYSQAVLADNKTLYVSGVLGLDTNAKLVQEGAAEQAKRALENLKLILEEGGATLESVVKTTILMADLDDFGEVNKVYGQFFTKNYPARATYQVARLPMDAAIEIEAIALVGDVVVTESKI